MAESKLKFSAFIKHALILAAIIFLYFEANYSQRLLRFKPIGPAKVHLWFLKSSFFCFKSIHFKLEMGPDPTWAYFWLAENKRPNRLWPGYFLTRSKGKKIEKFDVFRGNFPNSNPNPTRPEPQKIDQIWPGSKKFDVFRGNFPNSNPNPTRPEPQKIDQIWPGSKKFDPDPSLFQTFRCENKVLRVFHKQRFPENNFPTYIFPISTFLMLG